MIKKNLMKQKMMLLFLAILMGLTFTIPAVNVQAATTLYNNATGTIDGYNYELWKDSGTTSMTLNGGGKFSCSWSSINNALFRIGKKFDSTKTYQQLGNISVSYGCNYNPSGNSYLCVYGWTKSPLVEYYIVDSWGSWRPPGSTSKGTITVDGGTYDVYQTTRVNQPSIEGNTTFQQYWSVRTSKRTSGTISVSQHFNQWANKGMTLGKMYECALTVEGYQSSGSADVYSNTITVGGTSSATPTSTPTPTPTATSNPGGSTIQCESMTKSGQYTSNISSPFSGVALYGNQDAITTNVSFSGSSSITLYGASNNSSTAQVSLYIGSSKAGTFYFAGTSKTASTVKFTASGSQTVKLVVESDNGSWDAYLDYFTVSSGSSNPTSTPTVTPTITPTPTSATAKKFRCFLLLGQSNMAGYPKAQASDKTEDSRILVLGYDNNSALGRVKDQWDVACPPLHEAWNGALGPGDWFAKTLIQKVPAGDTIGLIPCAISGEKIETFMKNGGSKYSWIINRAKLAQQKGGVIEGILFHQGESNSGDSSWPGKVKTLVTDLRNDLKLGNVPFLAGELLYSGPCAGHNTQVNKLPSLITNCYVVSANGLVVDSGDTSYRLHFSHDSQVTLGKRYAERMIQLLNLK